MDLKNILEFYSHFQLKKLLDRFKRFLHHKKGIGIILKHLYEIVINNRSSNINNSYIE